MNLITFASFILFCFVLSLTIKRNNRSEAKKEQDFWDREQQANQVRRKPLDDLDYVSIPLDTLPVNVMAQNTIVKDCLDTLSALADEKIVNFAGITNTDLKLTYGAANITALSQYDQNFTLLVQTLQKWAKTLHQEGYIVEARQVLEYAVSIHSDAGTSYRLLAAIHDRDGEQEKVAALYDAALALTSPSGKTIARTLRESYPYIDTLRSGKYTDDHRP